MTDLYIEATKDSPEVIFTSDTGEMTLRGKSFPEDCNALYERLINWLDAYGQVSPEKIRFKIFLDYISSTSSIAILKMFLKIKELQEKGADIKIYWYYAEGDDDIKLSGEQLVDATEVNMIIEQVVEV